LQNVFWRFCVLAVLFAPQYLMVRQVKICGGEHLLQSAACSL
jgi:hypothetical protein